MFQKIYGYVVKETTLTVKKNSLILILVLP